MEKAEEERKKVPKNSNGMKTPNKPSLYYFTRTITIGPSHQSEVKFADDTILEDGFDAEVSEQTARRSARQESLDLSEMHEV